MFVMNKEMERANSWIKKWSNQELINQIRMYETIIDFDRFEDFIFADEILELYKVMQEECVERLAKTLPMSNRGNVNANLQNLTFEEMLQ